MMIRHRFERNLSKPFSETRFLRQVMGTPPPNVLYGPLISSALKFLEQNELGSAGSRQVNAFLLMAGVSGWTAGGDAERLLRAGLRGAMQADDAEREHRNEPNAFLMTDVDKDDNCEVGGSDESQSGSMRKACLAEIADVLTRSKAAFQQGVHNPESGYIIDILVNGRLAIELQRHRLTNVVVGTRCHNVLTGSAKLRRRVLEILGFNVVPVSIVSWATMTDREKQGLVNGALRIDAATSG